MSQGAVTFQIGKAGITPVVIAQLDRILEHHKHIRISVLPSAGRNRDSIHDLAAALVSSLKASCEYRIIGFTIALRRAVKKGL